MQRNTPPRRKGQRYARLVDLIDQIDPGLTVHQRAQVARAALASGLALQAIDGDVYLVHPHARTPHV